MIEKTQEEFAYNLPSDISRELFIKKIKNNPGYRNIRLEQKYLGIINNYYNLYEKMINQKNKLSIVKKQIQSLDGKGVSLDFSMNIIQKKQKF